LRSFPHFERLPSSKSKNNGSGDADDLSSVKLFQSSLSCVVHKNIVLTAEFARATNP